MSHHVTRHRVSGQLMTSVILGVSCLSKSPAFLLSSWRKDDLSQNQQMKHSSLSADQTSHSSTGFRGSIYIPTESISALLHLCFQSVILRIFTAEQSPFKEVVQYKTLVCLCMCKVVGALLHLSYLYVRIYVHMSVELLELACWSLFNPPRVCNCVPALYHCWPHIPPWITEHIVGAGVHQQPI